MKLNKKQLILLGNICKKDGMTGSSSGELDEMVKNSLLTKQTGPFGDVVYHPTIYGKAIYRENNK